VKATPAFDLALCQRHNVTPLEFDGREDSIFHPHDGLGRSIWSMCASSANSMISVRGVRAGDAEGLSTHACRLCHERVQRKGTERIDQSAPEGCDCVPYNEFSRSAGATECGDFTLLAPHRSAIWRAHGAAACRSRCGQALGRDELDVVRPLVAASRSDKRRRSLRRLRRAGARAITP